MKVSQVRESPPWWHPDISHSTPLNNPRATVAQMSLHASSPWCMQGQHLHTRVCIAGVTKNCLSLHNQPATVPPFLFPSVLLFLPSCRGLCKEVRVRLALNKDLHSRTQFKSPAQVGGRVVGRGNWGAGECYRDYLESICIE